MKSSLIICLIILILVAQSILASTARPLSKSVNSVFFSNGKYIHYTYGYTSGDEEEPVHYTPLVVFITGERAFNLERSVTFAGVDGPVSIIVDGTEIANSISRIKPVLLYENGSVREISDKDWVKEIDADPRDLLKDEIRRYLEFKMKELLQ